MDPTKSTGDVPALLAEHSAAAEQLQVSIDAAGAALARLKAARLALRDATRTHVAANTFRDPWPGETSVALALERAGLVTGLSGAQDVRDLGVLALEWADRVQARAVSVQRARDEEAARAG